MTECKIPQRIRMWPVRALLHRRQALLTTTTHLSGLAVWRASTIQAQGHPLFIVTFPGVNSWMKIASPTPMLVRALRISGSPVGATIFSPSTYLNSTVKNPGTSRNRASPPPELSRRRWSCSGTCRSKKSTLPRSPHPLDARNRTRAIGIAEL
jgi:hypothetical protein